VIDGDLTRKLAGAGVDLGVMGIQWGRRPERPPACSLTDRDLRLLRFVHDFGYVSTSTLAAMFWGRYGSAVRERLKLLHDIGLLDRLRPRVGRTMGAPEWVYRLTLLGWRVLRDQGESADTEAFRPSKLTSIAYVEHDVQVAALMTQIAARAAESVGRSGPLIDAAPFGLLGARSGTIDPRTERRAPDASPASGLAGRRVRLGRAHPGVLKPDATMIGVDRHGNRTAVMFEFDRTGRASKQIERLQRYDWFLTMGWRETRYACLDVEPAVLFVCHAQDHIRGFARVASEHLTAAVYAEGVASEYVGREQLGFVARASAAQAALEVHGVPSRDGAHAHNSVVQLLLPALFVRAI
jgi:hypothetical protein